MVQFQPEDENIRVKVVFFQTQRGNEPVREWLKSLHTDEKRVLGEDLKRLRSTIYNLFANV